MVEVSLRSKKQKPSWKYSSDDEPLLNHFHYRLGVLSHKWRPPTDVFETEEAVFIKVEIAGMRETDFSIFLSDRAILIEGNRMEQEPKRAYHQMEIRSGEFSTEIELHWPVETEEVQAVYKNGFLRIILPKAKTHQININE